MEDQKRLTYGLGVHDWLSADEEDQRFWRLRRHIGDQKKTQDGDDDVEVCEGCMMGSLTVKKFPKPIYGQIKRERSIRHNPE